MNLRKKRCKNSSDLTWPQIWKDFENAPSCSRLQNFLDDTLKKSRGNYGRTWMVSYGVCINNKWVFHELTVSQMMICFYILIFLPVWHRLSVCEFFYEADFRFLWIPCDGAVVWRPLDTQSLKQSLEEIIIIWLLLGFNTSDLPPFSLFLGLWTVVYFCLIGEDAYLHFSFLRISFGPSVFA